MAEYVNFYGWPRLFEADTAEKRLGLCLKVARLAVRKTQRQVSVEVGLCAAEIGNYEAGRVVPPSFMLVRLCRLYGVSLDDLFDRVLVKV